MIKTNKIPAYLGRISLHLILIAGAAIMIMPFVWMLSSSLKTNLEIFRFPPNWIPEKFIWQNYLEAFRQVPMAKYYWNSIVVSTLTTVGQVSTAILAAYVFARLWFPYKDIIFMVILATMMIPEQVKMIPSFLVVRSFGWIDSYAGIIVPSLVHPFGIFMLRQFFLTIPKDLEDAARMDGCSRLGILFRVILPLSKAPVSALSVFVFLWQWNSFLWPLIILNSQEKYTLQIGLAMLRDEMGSNWPVIMAATSLATLPLLVLFLIAQRQFIRGITMTGLKY